MYSGTLTVIEQLLASRSVPRALATLVYHMALLLFLFLSRLFFSRTSPLPRRINSRNYDALLLNPSNSYTLRTSRRLFLTAVRVMGSSHGLTSIFESLKYVNTCEKVFKIDLNANDSLEGFRYEFGIDLERVDAR